MPVIADMSDLREAARRAVPRPLFDWVDRGSFNERTAAANCDDFHALKFCQRALVDVSGRSGAVTLLGEPASLPIAISPTGFSGVLSPRGGELLAARAARAEGIPFTLAMLSVRRLEDVVAEVGPVWFQIAMLKRRELLRDLVKRAEAAGCPVLVLTTTMPTPSRLNASLRNRLYEMPPRLTFRSMWDYGSRPSWLWQLLTAPKIGLGNFEGAFTKGQELGEAIAQFDDGATWKDLEWLRSIWPRKLIVKGIMNADDARQAVMRGVDGVSVSNHGGIQLDDAPSTITTLREVVDAVAGRAEVLLDGGVRSGQDVLKAVALGAKGCLLGRAHLYGLAAGGEAGVRQAIAMIRQEVDFTMALTGTTSLADRPDAMLVRAPQG